MAQHQDLPIPQKEQSSWSARRLFPIKAAVSVLTKHITNVYEILLVILILIVGIIELTGRHPSWMMYLLTVFMLIISANERRESIEDKEVDKK